MPNILLREFFNINLTDSQLAAVQKLELFLQSKDQCFILTGYAGTGKTFLLKQLSQYFNAIKQSYYYLAPTGRAAKIIRERTEQQASTIHSKIYEMDENRSTVEVGEMQNEYRLYFNLRENADPTNTVYIVDESSMISDTFQDSETLIFGSGKLLSDLISYANLHNTNRKIIFIGDPAQLPPFQSNVSPALSKEYLEKNFHLLCQEYQLTDVYRQSKESQILLQATQLRNKISQKDYEHFPVHANESDLKKLSTLDAVNQYIEKWENSIFIASTNATVYRYNKSIREAMGLNELTVNERLLVTKNCVIQNIPLLNGDFVYTKWVSPVAEKRTVRLKEKSETVSVTLVFRDLVILAESGGKYVELKCKILENHLFRSDRELSALELRALIVDFAMRHREIKTNSHLFKQALRQDEYFNALQVKFGYAMTCHKSQGGEWEEVFVDFGYYQSIQTEQFFRWSYTAITRSKKQLYVINIPENSLKLEGMKPINNQFLGLNKAVENACRMKSFHLELVQYHSYHVQYTIKTVYDMIRVNLWYNAENIITSFTVIDNKENEEVQKLNEIFNCFIGQSIFAYENDEAIPTTPPIVKMDLLLRDLRKTLENIDVKIKSIHFHNYLIKYTFFSKESECTINFYYNRNEVLTNFIHEKGDEELTKKVLKILGLKQ